MGNKTHELISSNKKNVILFAFEEAIGKQPLSTALLHVLLTATSNCAER
jgi:hypothetical protein